MAKKIRHQLVNPNPASRKFGDTFLRDFMKYYEENFQTAEEFLTVFAGVVTAQYEKYDDVDAGLRIAKPILDAAEKVGRLEQETF